VKEQTIDQWNRIKISEIDPHKHDQLISDKRERQYNEGKILFFNKWYWNNRLSICKKINLGTDLTDVTKINSEWITDLNVKHRTIKPLEDNIGESIDELQYGDDFLDKTPKA